MRADNTSVVTLMLDPPGPPRATVLRSRTTATKSSPSIAPVASASLETESKGPTVPQNGLTIMTRYMDPDKVPVTDVPIPTPLPITPPVPETNEETEDSDAMTTYGNPAESYFMARLLNRNKVVNTLAAVLEELVSESSEPRVTPQLRESLPATLVPEPTAEPVVRQESPPPAPPAVNATGDASEPEEPNVPPDDGGIQINEVSSSSPTEAPPKSRGRRNRSDVRKDAPARPDRVLRSHHEPEPPRPQTRQTTDRQTRGKPAAPAMDRVVILTRRTTPPVTAPVNETVKVERAPSLSVKVERAPSASVKVERAPSVKVDQAAEPRPRKSELEEEKKAGRATRSQAGTTPLAQKITRSIGAYARELRGAAVAVASSARSGNSMRGARGERGTRRGPPTHRSKENLAAPRVRARAAPAAAPHPQPHQRPHPHRTRQADNLESEVHSTTTEACMPEPAVQTTRPRALRSRNDAARPADGPATSAPCKRSRCEDSGPPASKAARLSGGERCARAIGKRALVPWAPAVALRNRLRRRLGK